MKVSVIVPIYNMEESLERCLDSLVGQTLQDMEVLLIDDGSTDSSALIMRDYANRYPSLFRLLFKENGGQGSARNYGIGAARGDYIGFVDADDCVVPEMFEKMADAAYEGDADMVACDYCYIQDGRKQIKSLSKPLDGKGLFFDPWVAPWNKLYKRALLTENRILFPELRAYEDTAFFADSIPYIKKIVNIDEPFVIQYYRETSTMNSAQNERVLIIFDVIKYIIHFYKSRGLLDQYWDYVEYFCSKIMLSSSILRICQVRNGMQRRKYLQLTLDEVNRLFPKYRNNRFFNTGIKGLYIRSINRITLPVYANLFYLIRYWGRNRL